MIFNSFTLYSNHVDINTVIIPVVNMGAEIPGGYAFSQDDPKSKLQSQDLNDNLDPALFF